MAEIVHPHDGARQLLPWYVNGTLSPEEAARVEAHLAACADCRAELAAERALAGAVRERAVDTPGDGWAALAARIRSGETPPPDAADDLPARHAAPVPFLRRRVPILWAVASPLVAASVAALVVAALPGPAPAPASYVALGTAPAARTGNLLVQLRPEATEGRMRALLSGAGARLVDGPTASGTYILRVAPARRQAALALLRAAPEVTLAQPIDPGS